MSMSTYRYIYVVQVAHAFKIRPLCLSGDNGLTPVQMTLALDRENQQPDMTEEQREI